MKTCIIVPIKTQNKRLPGKTFRQLNGKPLYSYLFETLKSQTKADIYIDSSDDEVLRIAKEWKFKTLKRPEEFNSDSTAGDQLLMRIVDMLEYDIIGEVHITSPFLSRKSIEESINIIESDESIDSLFGIVPRYNRFWYKNRPINHDIGNLARTQDLVPIYEEADYYFVRKISLKKYEKRICGNIKTYKVGDIEAVDIDTLTDFIYAESLAKSGLTNSLKK